MASERIFRFTYALAISMSIYIFLLSLQLTFHHICQIWSSQFLQMLNGARPSAVKVCCIWFDIVHLVKFFAKAFPTSTMQYHTTEEGATTAHPTRTVSTAKTGSALQNRLWSGGGNARRYWTGRCRWEKSSSQTPHVFPHVSFDTDLVK